MRVPDANLLLYACNRASVHHAAAQEWIHSILMEEEPVGFAWVVVLGFLRISTNPRVQVRPLSIQEATNLMDQWFSRPNARFLSPGEDHWRILQSLLLETGAAGNLTTDAHLAALAIENGATLYSTDTDFQRFPRLRYVNPLKL